MIFGFLNFFPCSTSTIGVSAQEYLPGGVCPGGCLPGGVCQGRGRLGRHPAPEMTTAAVGTHSTGMHSCFHVAFGEYFGAPFGLASYLGSLESAAGLSCFWGRIHHFLQEMVRLLCVCNNFLKFWSFGREVVRRGAPY